MSARTTESTQQSATERKAVYISGCLGTLYDRYRDQMLEKLDVTTQTVTVRKPKTVECKLIHGQTSESENLLQMIGIQDDLRMSLLLNLVPRTELTSLIDYSHPINEYTRFLHYTYIYRIEKLRDNSKKVRKQINSLMRSSDATHIINSVSWGIDFVAVLQLPSVDETAKQIDNALKRICSTLDAPKHYALKLVSNEESLLERITSTKIYSNIPALICMKTIRDVYVNIYHFQANKIDHRPIDFGFCSIQEIHAQNNSNDYTLNPLYETRNKEIEKYLLQLSNAMNYFKSFLIDNVSYSLSEHLKEQLSEACIKWFDVKKKYAEEIERFTKLVVAFRKDGTQISQIEEALNDEQNKALKMKINELTENIKQCQYCNGTIHDIGSTDNEQKLAQTLIRDDRMDRVLCSTDILNKDKASELDRLHDDDVINILLLGESGVGKSTFINAFVNYIQYETLKEAESSKPVVLIPVSFLITAGDNFEEHTVKFGDLDERNNEDFDHPGQSVTQQCTSHIFDHNHTNGKKLRIIDTPGFGDTRGLDQDDLNMQHILQYINNLKHLNAVCFLLKPNASRLNIFFRTCLTELLDLLGPNARQNIIFCFTNARTTFYTPGDTAPPLRLLLNSMPMNDIPFKKGNTFCFDNESFRYLVALQNSVQFSELDRNEYEKSWSTSVNESNRLLNYICNNLSAYHMHDQLKSVKHAQFEITHMIRPMLEAIRNTLRNSILWDKGEKKKLIVLCPKAINRPTTICLSCGRSTVQLGKFSIINDCPHDCLSKCVTCQCGLTKHISVDYILEYKMTDNPSNHNRNEMTDQLSLLFNACIEFAHFLMNTAHSSNDNPVLAGLTRMIDEEKKICSNKKLNPLNEQLLEELKKLKNKYEYRISEMKSDQNNIELPVIYERIKITRNYPGVHEQMDAVEKGQELIMKYYEHEISNNLMSTSNLTITAL